MTAIREEELNMVNGGTLSELVSDSEALYDNGYLSESYTKLDAILAWPYCVSKVVKCWRMPGVDCDPGFFSANKYSYHGQEITRDQALTHLHV